MSLADLLCILMLVSSLSALLLGYPVSFTLAGAGVFWGLVGVLSGAVDLHFLGALPSRVYGNSMTNTILIAVPMFIFMGFMLERSKVAEELLETMGSLFGSFRGGLGISVALVGGLLSASTGIVGATVVTMGLLSLPSMLKHKYSPSLSCGMICASGTLGQIIPPSIVLILLGDQISHSYIEAQRNLGNFSPEPISIGDLFAGALLPGLLLVCLYILYQIIYASFRPESAPAISRSSLRAVTFMDILLSVLPALLLICAVLGSILFGLATSSEAASVGAVGGLLLGALKCSSGSIASSRDYGKNSGSIFNGDFLLSPLYSRLLIFGALFSFILMLIFSFTFDMRIARIDAPLSDRVAIILAAIFGLYLFLTICYSVFLVYRSGILTSVLKRTMESSSMIFALLIGAMMFSLSFRGLGGDDLIENFLLNLPGGFIVQLSIVMLLIFFLGFFLDFIEIIFVVVPLTAPVLLLSGVSPVWLGVLIAMNLQTSFLTPPFGFSLFYLRGVAPSSVSTLDIYRGVAPFIVLQLIGLLATIIFPGLTEWLPFLFYGSDYSN